MADQVVKKIQDQGGNAVADYGNVTNEEEVRAMIQLARQNLGNLIS